MKENYDAFTNNLKRYMGSMSNSELSRLSGVGKTAIFKYRNRLSNPTLFSALRIAKALDIPLSYLTEGMVE